MDILTLRNELQALLSAQLGTYTFINASTTPAISVRAAGEGLPAGTRVTGLEVVLVRDPALVERTMYRNSEAAREWTVFLVGWTTNAPLAAAAGKILYTYNTVAVSDVSVPEGAGPAAQKRIVIRTNPDGISGSGQS